MEDLQDGKKELVESDKKLTAAIRRVEEGITKLNLQVIAQVKLHQGLYLSFEPGKGWYWVLVLRDHVHPRVHAKEKDRSRGKKMRRVLSSAPRDRKILALRNLERLFEQINVEVGFAKKDAEAVVDETDELVKNLDKFFAPATENSAEDFKSAFNEKNRPQEESKKDDPDEQPGQDVVMDVIPDSPTPETVQVEVSEG